MGKQVYRVRHGFSVTMPSHKGLARKIVKGGSLIDPSDIPTETAKDWLKSGVVTRVSIASDDEESRVTGDVLLDADADALKPLKSSISDGSSTDYPEMSSRRSDDTPRIVTPDGETVEESQIQNIAPPKPLVEAPKTRKQGKKASQDASQWNLDPSSLINHDIDVLNAMIFDRLPEDLRADFQPIEETQEAVAFLSRDFGKTT